MKGIFWESETDNDMSFQILFVIAAVYGVIAEGKTLSSQKSCLLMPKDVSCDFYLLLQM